jgi:ribosomal protein L7/L12
MLQSKEFNEALDRVQQQLLAGSGLEPLLFELRGKGADKIDSIRIVKSAMNVSMGQAKSLVDRSQTWSDRYVDDRAFHSAAREAAEKLRSESGGPEVVIEERSVDPYSEEPQ